MQPILVVFAVICMAPGSLTLGLVLRCLPLSVKEIITGHPAMFSVSGYCLQAIVVVFAAGILGLPKYCAWGLRHLVGVHHALCHGAFFRAFWDVLLLCIACPLISSPLWMHRLLVLMIDQTVKSRIWCNISIHREVATWIIPRPPTGRLDWDDGKKGACIGRPYIAYFGCIETVTCCGGYSCRCFRPHENARIQSHLEYGSQLNTKLR